MYTDDELKKEIASFQDVISEVNHVYHTDFVTTPESAWGLFIMLPSEISDTARRWGLSDTVFRDDAYTWIVTKLLRKSLER